MSAHPLIAAWNRAIEPAPVVQGVEHRQNARLLSSLLAATWIGISSLLAIYELLGIATRIERTSITTSLVMVAALYFLSRRGYYEVACWLGIVIGSAIIIILPQSGTQPVNLQAFDFLAALVVFGSFFLSVRALLMVAIIQIGGLVILAAAIRGISPATLVHGTIAFNAFSDTFVLLVTYHRRRLERERQWLLTEAERQRASTEAISLVMVVHSAMTGRFLKVPPSFCHLLGYSPAELLALRIQDITYPADEAAERVQVLNLMSGAIQSFDLEKRYVRKDGTLVWVYLNIALVRDEAEQPLYILGYVRDITEQKRAQDALRDSEQRYRQLLESTPIALVVVDLETQDVLFANPASQALFPALATPPNNAVQIWQGLLSPDERERMMANLPPTLHDVSPSVTEYAMTAPNSPTINIVVHTDRTEYDRRPALLVSINNITETKRALQAEAEQRQFTEALLDIAAAINSTPRLAEVLDRILSNVSKVVEHDSANIMLIEDGYTQVVAHRGYSAIDLPLVVESHFSIETLFNFNYMVRTRTPVIVPEIRTSPHWNYEMSPHSVLSYIGAPIVLVDRVIGFVNLDSRRIDAFQTRDAERLRAFTNQIAIAIQSAQAFERAREDATSAERQRLARELHDAVSQTLFSASMTAETLPYLIDHDPDFVRQGLTQLVKLTKGALSEMRTLLVELRPSALEDTELSILLSHLVNGLQTRTTAKVAYTIEGVSIDIPKAAKISLYRIAQEALNNVVKHADAAHVALSLNCEANRITLCVTDDGAGFDPDAVAAEHMGVRIMRERAADAAIALTIRSTLRGGTRVEGCWEAAHHESTANGHPGSGC